MFLPRASHPQPIILRHLGVVLDPLPLPGVLACDTTCVMPFARWYAHYLLEVVLTHLDCHPSLKGSKK